MASRASEGARRALSPDYDRRPERFRTAREMVRRFASGADVHERVAERMIAERVTPVLDVGCGEGALAGHLPKGGWVGVDTSMRTLERAPQPCFQADATALPFPDESFDSVAMLYVLHHLPDPETALREARRVLRPGGLIAVAAPSRDDSPETLGELFDEVEVRGWDGPLLELPTRGAVRDYLVGRGVVPSTALLEAAEVKVPMTVTKRGALVFGRRA